MSRYVLPDNTVLVNFTTVDRHDLVEWIVNGRGTWGLTVSRECAKSAELPHLRGMTRWKDVFGQPLCPEPAELGDAKLIADQMRKPGENQPGKHMGEAETVAIVTRRSLGATFLTDDRDAARVARRNGIAVRGSRWIIAMAQAAGKLDHEEAHDLLDRLHRADRHLGAPPTHRDYDAFVQELVRKRAGTSPSVGAG